jgi:DNA-binding MarR family transcriptional regulator
VRRASRFLRSVFDEAFRPLGIQASQGYLLVTIATFGEDGVTISAIADALIMDRTTLSRNVRPLEKAGLVRVARSPDDARSRILFLTHAGERMIERMPAVSQKAVERLREVFGPTCVLALKKQLADFLAAVSRTRTAVE